MNVPAILAAHAVQQQRREDAALLDLFRLADATAPTRAVEPTRIGAVNREAFARLEQAGVLRTAGRDRYYLDEAALIARREAARTTTPGVALVIVGLALFGLVLLGVLLAVQ